MHVGFACTRWAEAAGQAGKTTICRASTSATKAGRIRVRALIRPFQWHSAERIKLIAPHLQIGDRLRCKGRELALINRALVEHQKTAVAGDQHSLRVFVEQALQALIARPLSRIDGNAYRFFSAISSSARARKSSIAIAPMSPSPRRRTDTVPLSASLSPTTSIYGIFCSCASRIL